MFLSGNPLSAVRDLPTGYTLVELLVVLGLLTAIAAVAWPSALRMQADHTLSSAVEQVRQQLAFARTRAIHTGRAYQFRFEPKGHAYCVLPFEDGLITTSPAGTPSHSTVPVIAIQKSAGQLGKAITFQVSSPNASALSLSNKIPDSAFQGLPNAGALASVGWSGPLIFQPDGSAADAMLTLGDGRGQRVDLSIRGLTGATSVGLMRREAAK